MSWEVIGRIYDFDNKVGLPGIVVQVDLGGGLGLRTLTDHDGYYAATGIDDGLFVVIVNISVSGFKSGLTEKLASPGEITDFPLGNETRRQRHPRGPELHSGSDYDFNLTCRLPIGSTFVDTDVHDLLALFVQGARDRKAPSFKASATFLKTVANIPAFDWSKTLDSSGNAFNDVAFGNGRWCAVGDGGTFYTIVDPFGTDWFQKTMFLPDIHGIAFDGTTWAISTQFAGIYTTTDPLFGTWTQNSSATAAFTSGITQFTVSGITFANGVWVAYSDFAMATATDPTGTWTRNTSFEDNVDGAGGVTDVHYGGGIWVATDSLGYVGTATDPAGAWTLRRTPVHLGDELAQLGYASGVWAAGGWRSATSPTREIAYIVTATDPTGTWTSRDVLDTGTTNNAFMDSMTAGDDGWWVASLFVAGSSPNGRIARTQDPTGAWTIVSDVFVDNSGRRVRNNGTTWLIVGSNLSGDGVIEVARSFSPTLIVADAKLVKTTSSSFTANAALKKNQSGSFSGDAKIV